jgi:hypothetical protein
VSLTATRIAFVHRCTIERDRATTDDWGQPGTPDWEGNVADLPCYAWVTGGREPVGQERTVVVVDLRVLLPLGTDVTESDRIGDITERGDVIFPGPHGIEAVLRQRDHLELILVRIA